MKPFRWEVKRLPEFRASPVSTEQHIWDNQLLYPANELSLLSELCYTNESGEPVCVWVCVSGCVSVFNCDVITNFPCSALPITALFFKEQGGLPLHFLIFKFAVFCQGHFEIWPKGTGSQATNTVVNALPTQPQPTVPSTFMESAHSCSCI